MTATAEAYGFGALAPYATPRASDCEMKERVRLSGLFPRVRNEPMSTQLQALLKDFEQNAALTGILERRRRLEERMQFELKGREGMDALNRNLAPPFRAGLAGAAVSADVADRLARSQEPGHSPLLQMPVLQLPRLRLLPKSGFANQLQKPQQSSGVVVALACRARAAALGVAPAPSSASRRCLHWVLRSPCNPQAQQKQRPAQAQQKERPAPDGPDRKDQRPARAVG